MLENNRKILCIGDSTSLPGHTNLYEDTWFCRLKENFPVFDFISLFRRSITTEILVTEGGGDLLKEFPLGADCLEFYKPTAIILQLGIVDCAPRLLTNIDKVILKFLPNKISNTYIKGIKFLKKRKVANTLVSLERFEENLRIYIERCTIAEVKTIILIGIPYPDERMIKKNPGIIFNIEKYNKCLLNFSEKYFSVKFINPLDSREYEQNIFADGYHPNPFGNNLVFQSLSDIINQAVMN